MVWSIEKEEFELYSTSDASQDPTKYLEYDGFLDFTILVQECGTSFTDSYKCVAFGDAKTILKSDYPTEFWLNIPESGSSRGDNVPFYIDDFIDTYCYNCS
jgi:hypothetical protein